MMPHIDQTTAGPVPPPSADLQTVLAAWNSATARLQQTHEVLRTEVHRLTDELALKNRELARRDRLADLGRMASHIAHEVRNNLVPVKLYLSVLRRRLADDSKSLDVADKVTAGITALDATVEDLLHFAADRDPVRQDVSVLDLVTEVRDSLAPQLAAQSINVEVDVPLGTRAWADRSMVRRAVLNMLLNALDAMPRGGQIVITCCKCPGAVELEVADSGPGLSDEARRRAFEPFYTTKSNGTGLGLAIVDHVAQAHGGEVTAINCPEGGAAFTLRLPHGHREAQAA
jgi:signal transduction histidine kinase